MDRQTGIIRTFLSIGILGIILVCLAASFGVSSASRNKVVCSDVSVIVRDSAHSRFVSGDDVLEYLEKGYGKTEGIPVNNLDLKEIESVLDSQSAVLKSEAYCTGDGVLHIDITQRKPLMRFQKGSEGFFSAPKRNESSWRTKQCVHPGLTDPKTHSCLSPKSKTR